MPQQKSKDLLLVIDMQNVYLPEEEWACPSMPEALKNTHLLIDSGKIGQILFTRYMAAADPKGCWQTYNREYRHINEDERLCAVTEDLQPYLKRFPLAEKSTYSSLKCPAVLEAVSKADRVLLTGVVAECCVLATMMEMIDLGCPVIYLTDCIAGQTRENEQLVETIARNFSPMHTSVMTAREYLDSLK